MKLFRPLMCTLLCIFLPIYVYSGASFSLAATESACTVSTASAEAPLPDSWLLPEIKTDYPAVSGIDVMIDVGHGGIDSGTVYGKLQEKDLNLAIARKTYHALQQKGFHVIMNRLDDYAPSTENFWLKTRSRHIKDLAQRTRLANELKPRIVISLHVNSARRAARRGAVILHQKQEGSKQLALALQQSLSPLYNNESELIYGRTFYLLKHASMPAVIVETGFITNAEDRALLSNPQSQERIAAQIAEGVRQYFNTQQPSSSSLLEKDK